MARTIDKREQAIRGELAALVRYWMRARGWSMARLAREAGVGAGTIKDVIHGRGSPMLSTVDAICGVLGIEVTIARPERTIPEGIAALRNRIWA